MLYILDQLCYILASCHKMGGNERKAFSCDFETMCEGVEKKEYIEENLSRRSDKDKY